MFEALKLPFASLPFYVPAPSFREGIERVRNQSKIHTGWFSQQDAQSPLLLQDQSAPVDTNYHLEWAMSRLDQPKDDIPGLL
jgi:hypothetical protein